MQADLSLRGQIIFGRLACLQIDIHDEFVETADVAEQRVYLVLTLLVAVHILVADDAQDAENDEGQQAEQDHERLPGIAVEH